MRYTKPTLLGLVFGIIAIAISSVGIAVWFSYGLQSIPTLVVLLSTLLIAATVIFMYIWRRSNQLQGS